MSIKEKIEKELQELVDETGGCEEDLKNEKLQIKQTLSFILLAFKDELMGMVPYGQEVDGTLTTTAYVDCKPPSKDWKHGFNACRSQMIAAINKLCEEK